MAGSKRLGCKGTHGRILGTLAWVGMAAWLCWSAPQSLAQDEPSQGPRGDEDGQQSAGDVGEGDDEHEVGLTPIEEFDLEALLATPLVESASRREQSLHDAPAAVSLITGDEIQAMGVTNPAEILRRVPGAFVMQVNANNYNVGLRGFNSIINNRVQVLVDGRNVGERNLGYTPWGWLPVHPSEIERLEVIRGPGTTLYGSNALSGVISITTRRPLDAVGAEGEAAAGIQYIQQGADSSVRASSLHNMGYGYGAVNMANDRRTFGARLTLGFNHAPEWVSTGEPGFSEHGQVGYYARVALEARPSHDFNIFATLHHSMSDQRLTTSNVNDPLSNFVTEQAFNVQIEHQNVVEDYLAVRLGVDGQRFGLITLGESINVLAIRGLLQADLTLWEGRNILTVGGEGAFEASDVFASEPKRSIMSFLAQNETELLVDHLLLSLGVRLEQIRYDDRDLVDVTYRNANPRAALIGQINENHDIRLSAATSYRTPTTLETTVDIAFEFYDDAPINRFVLGNPALESEQLRSIELGYRGLLFEALRIDAALYYQQHLDRVALRRELAVPLVYENVQDLDQIGIEVGLDVFLSSRLTGYLNYNYTRSTDATTDERVHEWPDHLVGAGFDWSPLERLRFHLDGTIFTGYRPFDLFGGTSNLQVAELDQPTSVNLNFRGGYRVFGGHGELFLSGRNLTGFQDDFDRLRQYPNSTSDPIGATVLFGLRIQEFAP